MNTTYPQQSAMQGAMQVSPPRSAATLSAIAEVLNAERERMESYADRLQGIADRTFGSVPTVGAGPNGPPLESPTTGGMLGEIQILIARIRLASTRIYQHLDRLDNGL
jgi:hypothetical protein